MIQTRFTEAETCTGAHTFDPESEYVGLMGEDVTSNRQNLIDYTNEHGMLVANTLFNKTYAQLAAFK